MASEQKNALENIYRMCRKRGGFKSQNDAVSALSEAGYEISHASLKDYERDARAPQAETVMALAEVYGTPELKWLHCSTSCRLGKDLFNTNHAIGSADVYRTFYELTGVFNNVSDLERRLHAIIEDDVLTEDEIPVLEDILAALDRVNENTKELRIWAEKHRKA